MKFKVRDGFVCKLVNKIDLGNGTIEAQESTVFAGQVVDLDADTAELHAHKLEPIDKAATAWLDAKVLPQTPASQLGVTPEMLAFAEAIAARMFAQMQQQAATPAA